MRCWHCSQKAEGTCGFDELNRTTLTIDLTLEARAKLKSGSKEPGKVSAGSIKRSALAEIAEQKMADLNANDIEQATKIIEGSARSMGLDVVEG